MKKLNIQLEKKKIPITYENLIKHKILSKAKVDILKHKAKRKVIIGGKGTGKTYPVKVEEIKQMNEDELANTYDFRKFKQSASDKLGGYFSNAYKMLSLKGFDLKFEMRKSQNKTYLLKHKSKMDENQKQEYASLDDITATDGGAPDNGGYYKVMHIDEPVVLEDIKGGKIASKEEFEEHMTIIRDNLQRFNEGYGFIMDVEEPTYQEYFTMNPWGDHPLILEAEMYLPEEKFERYIFSGYSVKELMVNPTLFNELFQKQEFIDNIILNSTLSHYQEDNDTLYSRMTKFANPVNLVEHKAKALIIKIHEAFMEENYNKLTQLIGTKHRGHLDSDMLVFGIEDFNEVDKDDFLKGKKVEKVSIAIDVDTSRVFTITPSLLLSEIKQKNVLEFEKEFSTFSDMQIELRAMGTGKLGELNDVYITQMVKIIEKYLRDNKLLTTPTYILIDDKRKIYLNEVRKRNIKHSNLAYAPFFQHGKLFNIEARQDMLEVGFRNKIIHIDKRNQKLINDMRVCLKADIHGSKRKTSGTTNYLDRLDSFEGSLMVWAELFLEAKSKEK